MGVFLQMSRFIETGGFEQDLARSRCRARWLVRYYSDF
jgi:hypothetical protein